MTLLKNPIPAIGLASFLLVPLTGQAQDWAVDLTDDYQIRNITNGNTEPLTIEDTAPSDVVIISAEGNLGLGASPPTGEFSPRLAISDPSPDIELDDPDDTQIWQIFGNGGNASTKPPSDPTYDPIGGIGFIDITANTLPFFVRSGAPTASFLIDEGGNVGAGTASPEEQLHVVSGINDFVRPLMVENTSGIGFSGFRLKIASDSWVDFNNSGGNFRINADQNPGSEFEVRPNGDARVKRNLSVGGTVSQGSDIHSKRDIVGIYQNEVLAKVMTLPISEWSYKDNPGVRHIGPMAQDFYKLFALGDTDKAITSIDTGGVAFAAIQGLKQEKDQEIAELIADKDAEIVALRLEFEQLKSEQDERIMQLEMALMELQRAQAGEVQVSAAD